LELKRHFGIDWLVFPATALEIWDVANRQLAQPDFTASGILKKFRVESHRKTDDPADDLSSHAAIAANPAIATKVLPTFRPDKAMKLSDPEAVRSWCGRLTQSSGTDTTTFAGFLEALRSRHDFLHRTGCRLSGHGLEACPSDFASEAEAVRIFEKARHGTAPTPGTVTASISRSNRSRPTC
jgi:glucuronate isomerase